MADGRHTIITNWVFYRSRSREKTELVMMVRLPSYNIGCPIYIWRIESKLWKFYKRHPHLSPHLQIRPCLVHPYLPQPHCLAIKKGISLWNNLAYMVAAAACQRRPSPCLHPFRPPVTTTLHSSSPYLSSLIFSMTFSRYQFFDKILEISLVFTHGITPAWVNHNRCFVKKCILMFRAMHRHLASLHIIPNTM